MTPEEIKKIKDRIAKLLNMTAENGCTEEEAENAMRMAAGLATRLGINLEEVRPTGEAKPKIKEKHKSVQMKVYEAYCAEAAAILYGIECLAPNYGKNGFWFTGREDNIELAEQTHLWLVRQVELLYKQHLPRGLSVRARADFRASFKDACGMRIYQRAQLLMRQMKQDNKAAQEATGSNALVVASYFEVLRQEIRDFNDEKYHAPVRARAAAAAEAREQALARMTEAERVKFLKDEEREKKRNSRSYGSGRRQRQPKVGSGTNSGYEAGDRVKLRQEMN
jgi:hypothetical protein